MVLAVMPANARQPRLPLVQQKKGADTGRSLSLRRQRIGMTGRAPIML
jgi:hypothetical protein